MPRKKRPKKLATLEKEQPMKPEKQPKPQKERPQKSVKPEKQPKPKKEKPVVLKPEKDETYKTRSKAGMVFLRVVFWGVLAFIFARGLITSLRPDTAGEALRVISDFKAELAALKELDNEVLAFAENFAFEYLTYAAGEEDDYKTRLLLYMPKATIDALSTRFIAGTQAAPHYVRAYRKESYSANQYDVYVVAEVLYTTREIIDTDAGREIIYHTETKRVMLKVPVYYQGNRYIIEGYPAYITDDVKLTDYMPEAFTGKAVDSDKQTDVLAYLSDFFKTYYEESQSKIDVYLAPDADKSDFRGLDGQLDFTQIESSSRVHYPNETDKTPLIALVTLAVKDLTGNTMTQNYTVTIIERDGRYYVSGLDVRIKNIKMTGG